MQAPIRCLSTQRVEFLFPGHCNASGVTPSSVNHMTGLCKTIDNSRRERTAEIINQEILFCLCGSQSNAKWSELFTLQPENKTTAGRTQRTIRHLAYVGHTGNYSRVSVISVHHSIHQPFFIYSRINMKMRENVSLKHIKEASISVARSYLVFIEIRDRLAQYLQNKNYRHKLEKYFQK